LALALAACDNTSSAATDAQPTPPHHGYVLAPHHGLSDSTSQELWDNPKALCDGIRIGAQRVMESVQNGTQANADDIPGRHEIAAGTWVDLIGHATYTCPDTNTAFNFSKVRITDGGSDLNNEVLYIQEGNLNKQ
jgi:hypothetical protein